MLAGLNELAGPGGRCVFLQRATAAPATATRAGGASRASGYPAHDQRRPATGVGVPAGRSPPRRPRPARGPFPARPAARGIVGVVVLAAPRSAARRRHRRGIGSPPAPAPATWAEQRRGGGSATRAGGVRASAPSGGRVAPAPAATPADRAPGAGKRRLRGLQGRRAARPGQPRDTGRKEAVARRLQAGR